MLPREQRMTDGAEFSSTVRRGSRAARPTLVTHVVAGAGTHTRVGLVVSKAVGSAVERNQVKRRLRHLMRDRVSSMPPGSRVVVRALPPASRSTWNDLAADLDSALARAGAR